MLKETRNQPPSGGMKLYFVVGVCKDFHQVSLWCLLLLWHLWWELPDSRLLVAERGQSLLRRCWCQQPSSQVLLAACISVEFLPSLPSPHGTGRGNWHLCPPYTPGRTCPEQTAAGAAEGGLVPDPLSCSDSLTKDGVGSTERSCLGKSLNEWAHNQFHLFCSQLSPPFQPLLKLTKVSPSFINIFSCSYQNRCYEIKWFRWRQMDISPMCYVGHPWWHVNLMS